jgi:hypothetical protein
MKLTTYANEAVDITGLDLDQLVQLEALLEKEGSELHPDLGRFYNAVIAGARLLESQIDHYHSPNDG